MIKKTLTAGAIALASTFGTIANSANIDLGFIMDSSGSVGSGNFLDAMDSLADALETNIPVGTADTYRITVITFSNFAKVTSSRTINAAQDLTDLANDIRNETFIGSTTNYQAAFDMLRTSVGTVGDISIANMMTDGEPCCSANANANAVTGRNDLETAGWNALSFESVTDGADNDFLASLAFDLNGNGGAIIDMPSQINDPLNEAFVLKVADFGTTYDLAISEKVQRIVDPQPVIPLPAGMPLMIGGLAIFGFVSRKKAKLAA